MMLTLTLKPHHSARRALIRIICGALNKALSGLVSVNLLLLSLCPVLPAVSAEPTALSEFWHSSPCECYFTPSEQELRRAKILFLEIFNGIGDLEAMQAQWEVLGFDWFSVEVNGERMVILKEKPSRCEGRGTFMFRTSGGTSDLIQIPHRFYDKYTGDIGYRLMNQGEFRLTAWNSIHRYTPCLDNGSASADLAHTGNNYFTVLAEAVALLSADSRIIQIHGFASSKRKTEAGRTSQIIVSDGTRQPSRKVQVLTSCLRTYFHMRISLFPWDVNELGATTNQIGVKLREYDHQGFMHIELSKAARKALLADTDLMTALLNCISGKRQ
ncbi:MAG: hypothetical protein PVI92_07965 [Chromatiales bacterium]|jgi:hypothetical protein